MDRSQPAWRERFAAVRNPRPCSLQLLLRTKRRVGRELGIDARNRCDLSEAALLRQSQDCRRTQLQSQADSATHAFDGTASHLSQAPYDSSIGRSQKVPIFAAKSDNHSSESRLEHRYHVRADEPWVFFIWWRLWIGTAVTC